MVQTPYPASSINLMSQPRLRCGFAACWKLRLGVFREGGALERVRSLLAVSWVEYCQVLACESVGNVKPNITRLGDRTRVEVEKQ
jgi:hypothetical protein